LYLKKLEILGFKSFATKTELLFQPGITAVVGPNGCGKTNVSDSIRWVLGEQSAKGLRASEMTDCIFNGTDSRKASSMAEVTLSLSNEDKTIPLEFNDISITRRVYRSGESEYLINKAPARLKDLRDLFMGTGLGVGAYSVMEQGKIDQIVTSKPVERRAIFEEAAGITKYKARKVEAVRKLESTEQNLIRISDIIAEIKRQITSLERQAKQAEKYRQFKEELGKLQVQIHLDKSAKMKAKLGELLEKIGEVKGRLETAQGETDHLEQDEKQQRTRLNEIDLELGSVREQAYKVGSEMEVTQGRMEGTKRHRSLLAEQKQRNEQQVAEALGRIEQLKLWVAERQRLLENKDEQKREKLAAREELQGKLSALENDLAENSRNLESKNATAMELLTQAAQMKAELESLKSQDEETSRRVTELNVQMERILKDAGEIQLRLERLKADKAQAQAEETTTDESILRFQSLISQQENRIEEINESLKQLNNSCSELRSRFSVLEELQNKFTGYDPGVKLILQAKQAEPLMWQEVLGVVADLISVDHSREGAVESLLGSQLQSLVVKSRSMAQKVISHLKAEGQGKVFLLVLEDLEKLDPHGLPEKLYSETGVVGSVISQLKYEEAMYPVVRFLFEQDIFVADWATAGTLSALYPRARFVTPEGDRLGPLGSMKAGSATSGVSLLGRHREMTELSDKIKALENQILENENNLTETKKQHREAEDSLLASETRRHQLKIRLAEAEKEITQLDEAFGRLCAERDGREKERAGVEAHWNADKNRTQELTGLLSQSEQAQHLTQEMIVEARRQLQELQARRDEASKALMMADLELSALEEVAARAREEADRYRMEQDQLAQSAAQKREENQNLESQTQQLSLDLDDMEKKVGGLSQIKLDADEKVKQILQKREAIAAETEERSEKVHRARTRFEEVQRELHSLEVQEAQFDVEVRNIEEKLQVEYKVDLDNPPVTPGEDFDGPAAEKESIELRAKIERLGLVNMVAVEEYDELSQRFKFLSEQREDLLRAKDDLQKAINKINLTSKELFSSTFAAVQDNFKDIFQRLFEGGRAELILIDEGDVLESGIEIVARPPGKRLQSVALLSGGEKALTAIALLFALFMVRPSPFCVLDEIDAPLDDVNVSRFTHLLKEFSKRTQFILITHNKVSMETADVMYGVTMQESGVSNIISTKFTEGEPEQAPVS
jgi:chromosome segregation protein